MTNPENLTGQDLIDYNFKKLREEYIAEYGFMPVAINPDGTPRPPADHKEEE